MASLEDALAANTAALKENTAALLASKGSAGGAAEAAIQAEANRKAAASTTAKTADGEITTADFNAAFAKYMGVEDEADRKARTANVVKIFGHYGVKKISEFKPEQYRPAAIDLKAYRDGGKPAWDPAEPVNDLLG